MADLTIKRERAYQGINSIADFFVTLIDEGQRKDKVEKFKRAINRVEQFDKAEKTYHDYVVAMANIANTPAGEIPKGEQPRIIYPPNVPLPPVTEVMNTDLQKEIDLKNGTLDVSGAMDTPVDKSINIPVGNVPDMIAPKNKVVPVKPDENLRSQLREKVYDSIGSLATQGEEGQLLANTLSKALQDSEERNKQSYFITTKGKHVVQASLTNPGEYVVIGALPEDKIDYKPVNESPPYEKDGQYYSDITFANLHDPNDTYTMVVRSIDPLQSEKFSLANMRNGRSGNSGRGSQTPDLDYDTQMMQELTTQAEQLSTNADMLRKRLNSWGGATTDEEYKKMKDELKQTELEEEQVNAKLFTRTGMGSKFFKTIYARGGFNAKQWLEVADVYKTFANTPEVKTIMSYLESGAVSKSLNPQLYETAVNSLTQLINNLPIPEEQKIMLAQYLLDPKTGGFMTNIYDYMGNVDTSLVPPEVLQKYGMQVKPKTTSP